MLLNSNKFSQKQNTPNLWAKLSLKDYYYNLHNHHHQLLPNQPIHLSIFLSIYRTIYLLAKIQQKINCNTLLMIW